MDDQIVKPASGAKPKPSKAGKPKPARAGKRACNLSLPTEDYERLLIHAMRMTNGNISELVCQLARTHLRDFHLARTPTRQGESDAA